MVGPEISLIHGPGCPVCVAPVELSSDRFTPRSDFLLFRPYATSPRKLER
ncbi:hypothetical protein [Nostoc sp. C117]